MFTKFTLILLLANFILATQARAAEFSVIPILGITTEIDDNRRLLIDESLVETTVGVRSQLELQILRLTEDTTISLTPRVNVNRFSEDIGLDTEATDINLQVSHIFSPKHQANLRSSFSILPVTTQSTVIDPVSLTAAGLSFDEIDRERFTINPSYSYSLTDRINLGASLSYANTQFKTDASNFVDSEVTTYSINGGYALTESDTLSATVFRREFKPDNSSQTINNAFQLGYAKDFSESFSISIRGGLTFSESETTVATVFGPQTFESSDVGELVSLSLQKNFGRSRLSTTYDRQVSPTSQGNEQVTDDLNVTLAHDFTERLLGSFSVRYIETENISQANNTGSQFFNVSGQLRYQFSKKIDISGGYSYREIEDINIGNPRDSNNIFVNVRYVSDKILF